MDAPEALRIIQSLADGIDPISGEIFPDDSPYQHPQIVRALFKAIEALKRAEERQKREQNLPEKAGKAWGEDEDVQLRESFGRGLSILELAQRHGRTTVAIQARLEKLGL